MEIYIKMEFILTEEEFKNYIKEELNISNKDVELMFSKTFYCLKRNLEKLTKQSLVNCLLSMDFREVVEYDKETDDFGNTINENNIHEINCNHEQEYFLCVCGQKHLKYLYVFKHNNLTENIVIGSKCIERIEQLKELYFNHILLIEKLEDIIEQVNTGEKALKKSKTHKPCYKCKDICIKKNQNFENKLMEIYCKSCLIGTRKIYIKCVSCKLKPVLAGQKISPDKEGYKDLCGGCWFSQNKNQTWFKKDYKKRF